ncbi:MAG: tetratricopeptide repeat protein [Byssovorax sp.]
MIPPLPDTDTARAIAAAPARMELWDDAERVAADEQTPDEVTAIYAHVLAQPLPNEVLLSLCERAAAFLAEWSEDGTAVIAVLLRALAIDPLAPWAFRRLTMLLTIERRWDELLSQYDRRIAATADPAHRVDLLGEAAQVARDLAGRADRAIEYLGALVTLRPGDAPVTASLERLLEREGRYRELVALQRSRLAGLDAAEARRLRGVIAACLLDKLDSPAEALDESEGLLDDPATATTTTQLLERAFVAASATLDDRTRALAGARKHYAALGSTGETIRVLQMALTVASPPRSGDALDPLELHHDVANLLVSEGREAEAVDHFAALLALDPASESAGARLRTLSERTGRLDRYADALAHAAGGLPMVGDGLSPRAVALLFEAGTVRADVLDDATHAAALFLQIFRCRAADPAILLDVCRRLDALFAGDERRAERLDVLERRAWLEPEATTRRELRTEAAQIADALGDPDRALAAYALVLGEHADDAAAHDASVALLDRTARWAEMVIALRRAADTKDDLGPALRVRAARVLEEKLGDPAAAIDAWIEIEGLFGAEDSTVDALTQLLEASERWVDLASALERALDASPAPARKLALLERLGDVYRLHAALPQRALGCYRAVLAQAPDHLGARAGLTALLEHAPCRADAVKLLLEAFAATGDWAGRLSLLEHRLELAEGDAARTDLLREAADLHEVQQDDRSAALAALARALPLSPDDEAIEARILALADVTGEHAVAARALGEAVRMAVPGLRAADLHERRGALLEGHLADVSGAREAYLEAFSHASDRPRTAAAVVRAAVREARWDVAATTIVASARARGVVDAELLAALEAAAAAGAAWDAVTTELSDAVEADRALSAPLAGELERRAAVWHRDHRADPVAAERALDRALVRSGDEIATLRLLADVQRRAPGASLVATRIRLADAGDDVLEALREAAVIALDVLHDEPQSAVIFDRLLREIAARLDAEATPPVSLGGDSGEWGAGGSEPPPPALGELAAFTVDKLVALASSRGDHLDAVTILVGAARLPLGEAAALARLHQAAAIAADPMGDDDRAITLLQAIVARAPADAEALARLSALFAKTERTADLLALRRHELALATTAADHLRLRLDIAELLGRLGDTPGRLAALRENLAEEPAHHASLEEIARLLTEEGAFADLGSVLESQAEELAERGLGDRAAALFTRAAELAEARLADVPRALAARTRAADFAPTPETFDALARLSTARGDHPAAVAWIERRLAALADDAAADRIATVARLAGAHVSAGSADNARAALERGLRDHPGSEALADPLRALYRAAAAWESLVELLTAPSEPESRVAHLREAADVLRIKLGSRERAIPILEALTALAPSDRASRLILADALRSTGALESARTILDRLLEEYGRRKPPERAEVHTQLALIASATSDEAEARRQLETAISMNPEHPGALRLLGAVYRDAGDLERSARMFGALLLIALRQPVGNEVAEAPARSEAMIHLHGVLSRLGQKDRAEEMLASAFEAAKSSDHEAQKLEQALRGAGDPALLLRALMLRIDRGDLDGAARAVAQSELADVLAGLGRHEEALAALLGALAHDPASAPLLARTIASARAVGREASLRCADAIEPLAARADEAGRREAAAALYFALGDLAERDLADAPRALAAYTRAESLGFEPMTVWRAIDRAAASAGDGASQIRVLRHLVFAGESGDPAALTEDTYRLAALELASPADLTAGLGTLDWAMSRDARHDRAGAMLRRAAEAQPSDTAVLAAYERVARAEGSSAMLLDALDRASAGPGASMDLLREAVDLAATAGDSARVEILLDRAVALGEANTNGLAEAVWALLALADLREAAADVEAAVQLLVRAIEAAEHDDALKLAARAADLAGRRLADPALATSIYERLLERDRHDREVWMPLLELHRGAGVGETLEQKLREAIECAFDVSWRIQLRRERAALLLEERWEDAAAELAEVLQEDEDDTAAAQKLTELYERHGRRDALGEILDRRLSSARMRNDDAAAMALSLQLGALVAPTKPEQAIDIYRAALETTPESAPLLTRLLALYTADDKVDERAEILERLLALSSGEGAPERALSLASIREEAGDDEGVARALRLGFKAAPAHAEIRARLAAFYTSRERWADLAEMLAVEGAAAEGAASIARLREAATLYLDRVDRPAEAAAALDLAASRAPDDRSLLVDLARCLARAGREDDARDRLGKALDRGGVEGRVALLRLRAELTTSPDQLDAASADLEAAYLLDRSVAPDLAECLERRRATPAGSGDRALWLRLFDLLVDMRRGEPARDLLGEWLTQNPGDVASLRQTAYLDALTGRWDQAVELCDRVVGLEEGPARVEAALLLAAACVQAGYRADARPVLEAVLRDNPTNAAIRANLKQIYEETAAHRELADLHLAEAAQATDAADKFAALRRAGTLLLESVGDPGAAVAPLQTAHELRPRDGDVTALLADAYISAGRLQEATSFLDTSIAAHKGRRSREASMLQQRMGTIAGLIGDQTNQIGWLNAALDTDAQNSEAASVLADVATELGQLEIALKALKAIALMKAPKPITRAMAYLRQALIAQDQGDVRKAIQLARKAQSEDANLEEAAALLAELTG